MISTKTLTSNLADIPSYWIFEYYCNLTERLTGQDIKIKSLFNPNERTPSFCIFYTDGRYLYKDFSTNSGGSGFNLVKELFNLTPSQTASKLLSDYNQFVFNGRSVSDIYI
jgi:hypothetical protein